MERSELENGKIWDRPVNLWATGPAYESGTESDHSARFDAGPSTQPSTSQQPPSTPQQPPRSNPRTVSLESLADMLREMSTAQAAFAAEFCALFADMRTHFESIAALLRNVHQEARTGYEDDNDMYHAPDNVPAAAAADDDEDDAPAED